MLFRSHKDLYKKDTELEKHLNSLDKNQEKVIKDILEIKKQIKDISFKVDLMLEILNNFTIMLAEEEEDSYDSDQTWVPEEYEDEDNDEDNWGNSQDES